MNDPDRDIRNISNFTCGCGCINGDCYCTKCHCQFYEKSTNVSSKSQDTNYQITKTKTENKEGKED